MLRFLNAAYNCLRYRHFINHGNKTFYYVKTQCQTILTINVFDYSVATPFKFHLTVPGIIISSLKLIGKL